MAGTRSKWRHELPKNVGVNKKGWTGGSFPLDQKRVLSRAGVSRPSRLASFWRASGMGLSDCWFPCREPCLGTWDCVMSEHVCSMAWHGVAWAMATPADNHNPLHPAVWSRAKLPRATCSSQSGSIRGKLGWVGARMISPSVRDLPDLPHPGIVDGWTFRRLCGSPVAVYVVVSPRSSCCVSCQPCALDMTQAVSMSQGRHRHLCLPGFLEVERKSLFMSVSSENLVQPSDTFRRCSEPGLMVREWECG